MQYFININGQTIGPMTAEQVVAYNVNEQTPVSRDGGDWLPLYRYPELMERLQRQRQYTGGASNAVATKKIVCGICAILVGTLGVQYFVMGKVAGGFITILLW